MPEVKQGRVSGRSHGPPLGVLAGRPGGTETGLAPQAAQFVLECESKQEARLQPPGNREQMRPGLGQGRGQQDLMGTSGTSVVHRLGAVS